MELQLIMRVDVITFLSLFFQTFLSGTIDLNIIGKECKTSEGEAAFSMTEQHTFSTDFL